MINIMRTVAGAYGTNIYLVYDEETKEAFVVDPCDYNNVIVNKIKELNLELKYIVLTHGHEDHICGVPYFKRDFPNALIIASKDEKEMLNTPDLNCSMEFCGKEIAFDADKYVDEFDSIEFAGTELKFILTPGHTKGSMCILMDDILFSGDTLFRMSVGRTDLPGGSTLKLMKSIKEKLFKLPDDIDVLPGHMDFTTIGFEKEHNPFA